MAYPRLAIAATIGQLGTELASRGLFAPRHRLGGHFVQDLVPRTDRVIDLDSQEQYRRLSTFWPPSAHSKRLNQALISTMERLKNVDEQF